VTLTVSPDPIHEGPCPASDCGPITGQDEATGALTVAETAGIGITLSKVEMELTADADGALIASGSFDGGAIAAQAGSRQVPAGGHLDVPVGVHYPIAQGGRNSTLKLTVRGDDANGNILTAVTTVPVVP
jgi:hypothetical protein